MGRPKLWTSGSRGISKIMYQSKKLHVSNSFNWVRISITPLITCRSRWHLSKIYMVMMPPPLWIDRLRIVGHPKPNIGFRRVRTSCKISKITCNWHKINRRCTSISIEWSAVLRWETWYIFTCIHIGNHPWKWKGQWNLSHNSMVPTWFRGESGR